MAEYRTSIDIDASPERVFDFLVTDAGMTSWMGQWASLDPVPGGQFAVDTPRDGTTSWPASAEPLPASNSPSISGNPNPEHR